MFGLLKRIWHDERGSHFLEVALYIILFTLAVAPFVSGLAGEIGAKMQEMRDKIGQVGGP
ncbi:hypothetical protein D7024_05205 [Desulfofundulus salinus]|uniref:Flp family type IVb pilin n=1 Tax=Desulfofundulus salinus TaxID=2419843 RepID=A0A494X0D5_9FIRM|nr:hypothetical protein D7024_05205 [Desulfofundulus salinum]